MLATIPFWSPDQFPFTVHLFDWGDTPIELHSFGVLCAIGFYLGTEIAAKKAGRDGLNPDVPRNLIGWVIGGAWLGGRISHELFYEDFATRIASVPAEVFSPFGGLSSVGGLSVAVCLVIWRIKYVEKVSFWPYADTACYGLMWGWIFGRMGCFSVHDHPGIQSKFPLAVDGICDPAELYWAVSSFSCHDLGFYEMIWAISGSVLFKFLDQKRRRAGFYVGMIAVLYGPFRFGSDFLRSIDIRHFGLTAAQFWAIGIFAVGLVVLYMRRNAPLVEPVATTQEQAKG